MVDVDDSTKVYKIGGVSKKVRYNDFWPNYSDRYVAIELTEKIMVELDDELYPSSVEVCLRVKPGTSRDFAEHLMKLSANQLSVGNLFILKVHDYEDLRNDFQQGSYNQVQIRFWMMGFLLLNILLGIVGTFWFRTQHRRAESALRIAVGSSRMQLWQRLNKEGLLLLTLAALPAAAICYNIGHLELTEGYMEWGVVRFLITFVITYFLMSLMILIGIWFPARQCIRIQLAPVVCKFLNECFSSLCVKKCLIIQTGNHLHHTGNSIHLQILRDDLIHLQTDKFKLHALSLHRKRALCRTILTILSFFPERIAFAVLGSEFPVPHVHLME